MNYDLQNMTITNHKTRTKHKGFTLVEMAIVLVIIGLLLSAIVGVGNAQIQQARISATKQKEDLIRIAIINYITRNNRLPCPAVPTIAEGAVGYGVEAPLFGTCTGTVINGAVSTGIVPWSSLGLTDENATDGYYNRFTYQVTLTATNTNAQTIAGLKGAISTFSRLPLAGNQSNDCTPVGGNYNPCSAVAIIVSHGNNGTGSYGRDGTQKALPVGADETENTNNDSRFLIKDYAENTNNPFDDILLPLSTSDLITPLTVHGSLQDYRSKINDDVSKIKNAVIARSILTRSGSAGSYNYTIPNNLPSLPANTLMDPWGLNYVYANLSITSINMSTDASLNAFIITTYGPDGLSGGNDDLQYVITVNELQDAFSKVGW
ncbi:prepilin-type N-terminal cleavage/methylation domain-containing protein [Methylotenera versatilis]|uniref:prepilin-type N-terminal cleavage/methylation domain-containing protein n=1 Tax=Methylotenera versatilis TaxID=1055487 RepID=UPI0006454D43|nr:type II secretion system protein [Methylotenera versatilis]